MLAQSICSDTFWLGRFALSFEEPLAPSALADTHAFTSSEMSLNI